MSNAGSDRSSSPAEEVSEEVLFALKDIFPCNGKNVSNDTDSFLDPLIGNQSHMDPEEEQKFEKLVLDIEKNIASVARILDMEAITPIKHCPVQLEGVCNMKSYSMDTESVFEDFDSDDSMKDPNYFFDEKSNSYSESQQSDNDAPAAKKIKKNRALKSPFFDPERSVSHSQQDLLPSTLSYQETAVTPLYVQATNDKNTPPSRKRKIHKANWKCNVRNQNRQKGKAYTDYKGVVRPPKTLKTVDCKSCVFLCDTKFDYEERQEIHNAFWSLDDKSKNFFYSQFTRKDPVKRKSKKTPLKKREYSYRYFFSYGDELVRVCKKFFLSTLDISAKRIQWFYNNKHDEVTGIPRSPKKGKNIKKKIPEHKIEEIKQHIESFPRVESHYCRATTKKGYLGSYLNITKMYNLYKESCEGIPVKKHVYFKIFNECLNLAFHMPKKDQCDLCSQLKNKGDLTEIETEKLRVHEENKLLAKNERDSDRKSKVVSTAIVTYDLENVFALPKAEVSSFYYKRKFAVYNLTGHCNLNKVTYCCIWTKAQSGRSGNDLASALYKILQSVVDNLPDVTKIILWSDSCVAQNKNRVNSTMLLNFLHRNPQILNITQKYSEPGHSQLQEVDSVHSAIERHLRGVSLYSPLSLVQQLLKIKYEKVHLQIMQMQDHHFFNFAAASKNLAMPPFSKLKTLKYSSKDLCVIEHKNSLSNDVPFEKIILFKKPKNGPAPSIFVLKPLLSQWLLTEEKKKDLKSMLKYMNAVDVAYYNAIFGKNKALKDAIVRTPETEKIEEVTPRRTTRKIKKKL